MALIAGLVLFSSQVGTSFPEGPLSLASLSDPSGKAVTIDLSKPAATVILFLNVECPIGNRYAPEMARIYDAYKPKGVEFFRVYIEPAVRAKQVVRHGVDFKLGMNPILDPTKSWAITVGAKVTPEAAIIGRDGTLKYRGRIDDMNIEHGKIRQNYRRDLRVALDEVLAGKPVSVRQTPAIGCIIP